MTLISALRQDGVTASLVLDDPNSAIRRYVEERCMFQRSRRETLS